MSEEIPHSVQSDALKAQIQMYDLGLATREHITTVDRDHANRKVNVRRLLATRECNDQGTEAGQQAAAHKNQITAWSNLRNFASITDDGDAQDDDIDLAPFAEGQSHRLKLQVEARMGNLEYEHQNRASARGQRSYKNRHSGKTPSSQSMSTDSNARDAFLRKTSNIRGVKNVVKGRMTFATEPSAASTTNISLITSAKRRRAAEPEDHAPRPSPRALRAMRRAQEKDAKQETTATSRLDPALDTNSKRSPRYSSSHETNRGLHGKKKRKGQVDSGTAISKPARQITNLHSHWGGSLVENPVATTRRDPSILSSEDDMRANPITAKLFDLTPINATPKDTAPSTNAQPPSSPKFPSQTDLSELTAKMAAFKFSNSGSVKSSEATQPEPGGQEVDLISFDSDSDATFVSAVNTPRITPVVAPATTVASTSGSIAGISFTHDNGRQDYKEALSSENAFWDYMKVHGKPKRDDLQGGSSSRTGTRESRGSASFIPPTNKEGWVNPAFLVFNGEKYYKNPFK